MSLTKIDKLYEDILAAIHAKDTELLKQYSMQVEEVSLGAREFDPESFALLMKLFNDAKFLELEEGSHHFLLMFEQDWELLTEHQKGILLETIERAYDKFRDWLSWFLISELLGEYFSDERALETLKRLKNISNELARSFVPHGFEHMVKSAKDEALGVRARSELHDMKNDLSSKVRDEVSLSLARLG